MKNIAHIITLAIILLANGCRNTGQPASGDPPQVDSAKRSIQEVLKEHTPQLMAIPGVVGTAIGADEGVPCILVMTAEDSPTLREAIPDQIDEYPVRVLVTGRPTIFDNSSG